MTQQSNIGLRRYVECAVFIFAWMGIGTFLQLGGGGYLLLGIHLLLIFQLAIVRQPLRKLWIHDEKPISVDFKLVALTLGLIAVPLALFIFRIRDYGVMMFVVIIGALPCAAALRRQRLNDLTQSLPAFVLSIAVGCLIFAGLAMWGGRSIAFSTGNIVAILADTFCFTLIGFVLEEVVFRGGLDGHLMSAQSTRRQQLVAALFTSLLWGLWHLPLTYLYPSREFGFLAVIMALNIAWGVPLSLCCRSSGTLILPSLVHAICDVYRNGIAS